MSDNDSSRSGGVGFLGFLGLLFIGLKLTGFISWSWILVLSPLWLPFAVLFVVAIFASIVYAIVSRK